jgi:lipid A oxidase
MKLIFGALAGTAVSLAAGTATADTWGVSLYGGWNGSFDSDVNFTGPDTDWTVRSVPWDGLSFTFTGAAPYYGARLSFWPSAMPGWGLALDFTHAKVQAHRSATVSHSGRINGVPTSGSNQVQELFDVLEFTDGLNLVTLNALYQLPSYGMFHPYIGAGVGISIPHVEVTGNSGGPPNVPFPRTFAYEFGGPAAQALIGAEVALSSRISLFGEYKLSWTNINSPMNGDYEIHTTVVTNHIIAGATFKFAR